MLLNRANLAVVEAATKQESRYALNGILCDVDGTTATDGYMLCHVSPPPGSVAANFPTWPGAERPTEPIRRFVLPSDSAREIAKALPKKSTIPILKTAMVCADTNVNGKAAIAVTDLEARRVFQPDKVDGQFPNWQAVIPKHNAESPATLTIALDGDLLERVIKVARALKAEAGDTRGPVRLEFSFSDAQSAAKIMAANSEGQELTAVVMPLR